MEAVLIGQYVGSFTKQFKGKDGKDISYCKVVLFNPDFFKEEDRYVNVPATQEVYKKLNVGSPKEQEGLMGKTYSYFCQAMPAGKGLFKLKVVSFQEEKTKPLTPVL